MKLPAFPAFIKNNKKNIDLSDPEVLYIIDRLQIALGEEFTEGLVGRKQRGYLSKTRRVAVLPGSVYPPYKSTLRKIDRKTLLKAGRYIGVLGGTLVEFELFDKTVQALEKTGKNTGYSSTKHGNTFNYLHEIR